MKPLQKFGLSGPSIIQASKFHPQKNLFIKLETGNIGGSIKGKTAYYIISDLLKAGLLRHGDTLVESTSGNLGIAMAQILTAMDIQVVCIADPWLSETKKKLLVNAGASVRIIETENPKKYRDARINDARKLGGKDNWVWSDQYSNLSGVRAHFETTGPEIWEAMNGNVDCVVAAVGTGGTICGVGKYLKSKNDKVMVVGVEPLGSTIFSDIEQPYMNVGAGFSNITSILRKEGRCVTHYSCVPDDLSVQVSRIFKEEEKIGIGITSGMALSVGKMIATAHPEMNVVVIAPDSDACYQDVLRVCAANVDEGHPIELHEVG